jgi:hypothetical protein
MSLRHLVALVAATTVISCLPPSASALDTTVVAEAHYLMADGDTLAQAEEKVLQRAKRKAIEEAGMYIESTLLDIEKSAGGRSFQSSSLEIRTIASAITKTEVLESSIWSICKTPSDAGKPNSSWPNTSDGCRKKTPNSRRSSRS